MSSHFTSRAFARASAAQPRASPVAFLYQTATIQGCLIPQARCQVYGQRHKTTHIPFESNNSGDNGILPADIKTSTISAKEKQVFAKLLDPSYDPKANQKGKGKSRQSKKTGKPARKYPARDVQSSQATQQIQDPVVQAHHRRFLQARKQAALVSEEKLEAIAPVGSERSPQPIFPEQTEELLERRRVRLQEAEAQFETARSDLALWEALDKFAFQGIRSHFTPSSNAHSLPAKGNRNPQELAVLTHNYPLLLATFLRILRQNFPSSHLAFSILPKLKALGRQSYVLGASTPLYNELVLAHWRIYSDFTRINGLLLEMDSAGLEFDLGTLETLKKILHQGERIYRGERGHLLKQVWELESMRNSWGIVVDWIPKVMERLELEALRKANEIEEDDLMEDWEDPPEQGGECDSTQAVKAI